MKELIELETALKFSRKRISRLYREYVNPGLASLLRRFSFDPHFVKATGTKLWDEEGKEYLDFLGGYGALNFGHNPSFILQALEKVSSAPNMLQTGLSEFSAVLAHNLAKISPGKLKITYFFFSGT